MDTSRDAARNIHPDWHNALSVVKSCRTPQHHHTIPDSEEVEKILKVVPDPEYGSCDQLEQPTQPAPDSDYSQLQLQLEVEMKQENGTPEHRYFFSLMVLELNEVDVVLEFIKVFRDINIYYSYM